MGFWQVFYESWQMECCGTPFSVGDEVAWPLLLPCEGDALGGGWSDELSTIVGQVERVRDEEGVIRVLRADDGLTAALNGDPEDESAADDGASIRRVGLLTVERHSGEWPETTGHVRAIRLVTQGYAETAPGSLSWTPVPGEGSFRAVDSCPKWFGADVVEDGGTASGATLRRIETGVLVELDVQCATPTEPRDRG